MCVFELYARDASSTVPESFDLWLKFGRGTEEMDLFEGKISEAICSHPTQRL